MPHTTDHTHRHHSAEDTWAGSMDEILDLDAEVLHDYWSSALDWVTGAATGTPPARVADLGAGTGAGSVGLAQRLPGAHVVAVDVSADSLRRLDAKATDQGLAERISTVTADLDEGWPDLGELDLTWASMSMHHLADPTRTLRQALAATRPGGLLAVAEFAQRLRFLPDELPVGAPGLENRILDTMSTAHAEELPTLGSEWAPRLAEAGWAIVEEREFVIDLDPPRHPDAVRYAQAWFTRLAHGLADRLDPDDRATLAALVGGHSPLLASIDLHIRGTRTVTLARRA